MFRLIIKKIFNKDREVEFKDKSKNKIINHQKEIVLEYLKSGDIEDICNKNNINRQQLLYYRKKYAPSFVKSRRTWTKAEKLKIINETKKYRTSYVCSKYDIKRCVISQWKNELINGKK